jgi:hypothetical protein
LTYQLIENFAAGLDTRKSPLTSPAGTLTRLVNAVVTPGGEIAKRRAFVDIGSVAGSFGLASTESSLYVFGRNVVPPLPTISIPGVTMKGQKIPNPATGLLQYDYDVYDGKIYLACYDPAAAFPSNNPHYYDAVLTGGTGKGFYVRTFQSKIYSVLGSTLSFSKLDDPLLWNPSTDLGAGYIILSKQDADSEQLTSLEIYYDKMAIFSTEAVQIWMLNPDDDLNNFDQLLRGTGTAASRSPLQYGNGDVLYLDQSGIRSLKARDSSNSASVSDIGSPVDPTIVALLQSKGSAYMNKAIALLEPSVGRFWMVFPDEILVLSYFPGPKITAWSYFTLPFTVQHAVTCGGKIFIRSTANRLYVYGGSAGNSYDNCGVEVRLPYLDGKKPGHRKLFQAVDATVSYNRPSDPPDPAEPTTGSWRVAVSFDPTNPAAEETIAVINKPTWNIGASELQGYDSHFSLRFYNDDDKPVTLSNCAVHYEMADDEA